MKRLSILLFSLIFFSLNSFASSHQNKATVVYCPAKIKCQGTVCDHDSIFSNIVRYKPDNFYPRGDYIFTHAERSRTSSNGIPANAAYCEYEINGEVVFGLYTYEGLSPWYNYFTNSWVMSDVKKYGACTPAGYGNPADAKACPWIK